MNIGAAQGWAKRCRGAEWGRHLYELASSIGDTRRSSGRLLLLGPAEEPPWHLAAHLDQMYRYRGEGMPTELWTPAADRGVTGADRVLAITEQPLAAPLLDRLEDLRSHGVPVFALSSGETDLAGLSDHAVALPDDLPTPDGLLVADFEIASHIVGVRLGAPRRRSLPMAGWLRRAQPTPSGIGVAGRPETRPSARRSRRAPQRRRRRAASAGSDGAR